LHHAVDVILALHRLCFVEAKQLVRIKDGAKERHVQPVTPSDGEMVQEERLKLLRQPTSCHMNAWLQRTVVQDITRVLGTLEEGGTRMPERKAQMEAIYTHMWASHEGGSFAPLDVSLCPRPHSMLHEVAAACGVGASSLVLDVGSGRGNHSCALAQRFGCTVVGLEVAQFHIEQGRARAVQEGVSDQVSFVQGDIEALPFEDERFDFLWSRDMLMHVPTLPAALTECVRVLKPGGVMLVYTTVATGRMEPKEAAWLSASFGLVPESMYEPVVEAAFQAAGFQMHSKEPLGSELMEWVEEYEGRASRELMRLARMLRKPEYYQELLGASRYEVALANYHWALYILLGKLSPTLYVLRKNASL